MAAQKNHVYEPIAFPSDAQRPARDRATKRTAESSRAEAELCADSVESAQGCDARLQTNKQHPLGPREAGSVVREFLQSPELATPARALQTFEEPKGTSTILVVDADEVSRRVIKAMLKAGPYRIIEAYRPSEALACLERRHVDLVIIDLVMPEMSGPELCRRIKSNRRNQFTPILMLTNVGGSQNEIDSIAAGADEFLTKPLHPEVIRTRVRAMLRNKAAIDSLEEAETILFALAQAVEARDSYTSGHCQRLARYSVELGHALGLGEDELIALHRGGYLHDIGKICVPDSILFKEGPLTDEEWEVMKSHTLKGEEICCPMRTLAPVLPIIRHHHERWDGSGYPDELAGEEIPLLARVLQIADVYDALTTSRPYKPALSREDAFRTMEEEACRGWRDVELLTLFRETCQHFREVSPMSISLEAMRRHVEGPPIEQ